MAREVAGVVGTVVWAVAVPVGAAFGGVLAQGAGVWLWVGVCIALVAVAAGVIVAGGMWHRAGAATLVAVAALALPFFAGPAATEMYLKTYGEQVDAVVADTREKVNAHGTELSECRVIDVRGKVRDLSQQQNCFGQFEAKDRVVLFEDPRDLLASRIEAPGDTAVDPVAPAVSAGLFVVSGGALLYAGLRRRPDTPARPRPRPHTRAAEPAE